MSFAQGKIITVLYNFQNVGIHKCKYMDGPLFIFQKVFPILLSVLKTHCMMQTSGSLNVYLVLS